MAERKLKERTCPLKSSCRITIPNCLMLDALFGGLDAISATYEANNHKQAVAFNVL